MSAGLFLILVIPLAAVALALAAAFALYDSRAPAARDDTDALVPVRLLCPLHDAPRRVHVGVDRARRRVAVRRCEQFGDGAVLCERTCFPELDIAEAESVQAHAA